MLAKQREKCSWPLPYWHRVPSDLQQQFLDEIVEDYLNSHPMDAEGRVHLPMVRLEVEAITGPT
jgi:trans-aconitate 2-methyltransferase